MTNLFLLFLSVRILLLVCCAISSVCAAPSSTVSGNELNGLARNSNGTSTDLDSEDTDENPLAVAWLVAVYVQTYRLFNTNYYSLVITVICQIQRYGCIFARATAVVCNILRTEDIGESIIFK